MNFGIAYHPLVRKDCRLINHGSLLLIEKSILTKLKSDPYQYGEPLSADLSGYWKLRVGNYRVIYRVEGHSITILGIRHRKDIYRKIRKRV